MNNSSEDVLVRYAPVYLIQDPGVFQANTYVITPSTVEQHNPVSNNLKTFYESSGNIDNDLVNVNITGNQCILKEVQDDLSRKNLRLDSFLMPKSDNVNKKYIYNNTVLKSTATANNSSAINSAPKIDMNRKIVKIKDAPKVTCKANVRRWPIKPMPKIKPKENASNPNPSKYTSVQLIKLGETYHSLNKLSDEQMKMVNQALKMFNDPSKNTPEPTYDPVTNTQYIYKVVSPRDLAVVGKRKLINKDKKVYTKLTKKIEDKEAYSKPIKKEEKPAKQFILNEPIESEPELTTEAKVTRSGRKVKLPKQILPEDSPHKSKKKSGTIVTCFQCSADFASLYRLQKHYENHPTHIPAKIHSNLFHCLLAIIKSGSDGDKTNIFIQQLEQLVVKLKSLLPCLLKKVDGTEGQPCTINDDIGRLFGMNPGKYNIDVDALNCVKDKNGYCIHNPPQVKSINKDLKKNQLQLLCNESIKAENETENCARINSAAKWPTVSKRIWKLKQKTQELNAKKIKLHNECPNECICINVSDIEDFTIGMDSETSANVAPSNITNEVPKEPCDINSSENSTEHVDVVEHSKCVKNNHIQFHSAHFDIRSSPIKSSSTVFRKFQIDSSKLANYEAQAIRPLGMVDKEHKAVPPPDTDSSLHDIFKDDVDLSCKESNSIDHELKEWIINTNDKSQDSFTKSLIEPALIHVKDKEKAIEEELQVNNIVPIGTDNHSNHTESVLNFLEELGNDLVYPETEIRNSGVDFQLDLFAFNTT